MLGIIFGVFGLFSREHESSIVGLLSRKRSIIGFFQEHNGHNWIKNKKEKSETEKKTYILEKRGAEWVDYKLKEKLGVQTTMAG